MSKKLLNLRDDLAGNRKTSTNDLELILKKTISNNRKALIDAYFVIAAKRNNQPRSTILDLFLKAYPASIESNESYKLVIKLEAHSLIVEERILNCLLSYPISKDWEVFLGLVHMLDLHTEFLELWNELDGKVRFQALVRSEPVEEWDQVVKLLNGIYDNQKFVLGT